MFFGGRGFFGGGGGAGGWTEEEYQAYVEKLQQERQARIDRMINQQKQIDETEDSQEKLELQRQRYKCGDDYLTIDDIPNYYIPNQGSSTSEDEEQEQEETISEILKKKFLEQQEKEKENPSSTQQQSSSASAPPPQNAWMFMRRATLSFDPTDKQTRFPIDNNLNSKLALIRGDITTLEVDAIVNAANSSLMGGGGVDGAIHGAAGPLLANECEGLGGARTGETKITKGYALPAKYILHTVGPIERGDRQLRACYKSSLDLCIKHNIKTVAFCCISTGIYSFPLKRATHIALDETRKFLNSLKDGTYVAGPDAMETAGPRKLKKKNKNNNKNEGEDDEEKQEQQQQEEQTDENNQNQNQTQQQKQQHGLDAIDKIIFCVFTAEELQCYEGLLPSYFPIDGLYPTEFKMDVNDENYDDFNRDDARPEYGRGGGDDDGGISNIQFV